MTPIPMKVASMKTKEHGDVVQAIRVRIARGEESERGETLQHRGRS
jgi:hypothetical protein